MKPNDAAQLLSLMKAKTQVEQIAFENIKRRQALTLEKAAQLRQEAKAPSNAEPGEFSADFYRQGAAHVTRLLENAKEHEQKAEMMTEDLNTSRNRLEKALQRELALENLADRFAAEARRETNKAEEGQHELVRTVQGLQRSNS